MRALGARGRNKPDYYTTFSWVKPRKRYRKDEPVVLLQVGGGEKNGTQIHLSFWNRYQKSGEKKLERGD